MFATCWRAVFRGRPTALRIEAQLIDALSGHHVWAERYDRDLKDLFAVQDEVTLKILKAMQVKLTEGEVSRPDSEMEMFGKSRMLFEVFGSGRNIRNNRLSRATTWPGGRQRRSSLCVQGILELLSSWLEATGSIICLAQRNPLRSLLRKRSN